MTDHLERRVAQHKQGTFPGFSKRYRINRLVYYELFGDIRAAIAREKKIKHCKRDERLALIESNNPTWADLAGTLYSRHSGDPTKTEVQIPRPRKRAEG